jgi:hypothetical protein
MLFAKIHVKESFGRQDVHGQAAVPERNAEAQFALPFEVDLVPVDGHFQNALERRFRDNFWVEQTQTVFFDGEPVHVAAF